MARKLYKVLSKEELENTEVLDEVKQDELVENKPIEEQPEEVDTECGCGMVTLEDIDSIEKTMDDITKVEDTSVNIDAIAANVGLESLKLLYRRLDKDMSILTCSQETILKSPRSILGIVKDQLHELRSEIKK